jgi:hypothetical protein
MVFFGTWNAYVAVILMLLGILVGLVLYVFGLADKARTTPPFVGGEVLKEHPDMRMSGAEFYLTIQDQRGLKCIYKLAEEKVFDIYEMGVIGAQRLYRVLAYFHNGVVSNYLSWCLLGMVVLFYILLK